MPLFHIVILALVQGLTEFLPISSSGHLLLGHALMGDADDGSMWGDDLRIDIAVHVGTLFAALVYFRKDVLKMLNGVLDRENEGRPLLVFVLIGSVPVILAGLILSGIEPGWMRSLELTAWCTLLFGIVLWVADKKGETVRTLDIMKPKDAVLIGLAQILALIPGTSRSGITMTAARALGFNRTDSARFSLLLALVAISGAGVLGGAGLWKQGDVGMGTDFLIAALLSFLAGWGAIILMMKWLEHASFTPFVVYRIVLGLILLYIVYF